MALEIKICMGGKPLQTIDCPPEKQAAFTQDNPHVQHNQVYAGTPYAIREGSNTTAH